MVLPDDPMEAGVFWALGPHFAEDGDGLRMLRASHQGRMPGALRYPPSEISGNSTSGLVAAARRRR